MTRKLAKLVEGAIGILLQAEIDHGDLVLSLSGRDSVVLNDIIKRYEIEVNGVFSNYSVESSHNRRLIKKIHKTYKEIHIPKARSYKEVCYQYGFPIGNKNFSMLCYRVKRLKHNNFIDRYRIVTGVSPFEIGKREINGRYALDLKYWYLAVNYPIQSECCRILKKAPSKKIEKPMIIGIMAIDSPERAKAISTNTVKAKKVYPLAKWNKQAIEDYIAHFNVEVSNTYKDRDIGKGITICGAMGSGCDGCHFGQKDNYKIIDNGIEKKVTKFESLQLEFPKKHKALMNMEYQDGTTFKEVIEVYNKSKAEKYMTESIEERNLFIYKIIKYMEDDERDFKEAITHIEGFIK